MRNLRNKNAPPGDGLVTNYIDSSYDVVKQVHANLDYIWTVAQALENGGLGGATLTISDTQPNGFEGLLWLNTNNYELYFYANGAWERFVYRSEFAANDGEVDINGGYF